jgi:hypothetical protein
MIGRFHLFLLATVLTAAAVDPQMPRKKPVLGESGGAEREVQQGRREKV